jgi:transcriptional regulator with XRE-family HTH domain
MARKLREMRSTTQLGQRDFAVEAGVACSTISRAESGTVWPTPATIAAYERITGLTWAV